jgi:hypothetical protein
MAVLLLVLLALAGLIVGDAIVENTSTATVTLAGQEMGGLTMGGWLTAFAVLGFLSAYVFLGMLAAARRNRVRRRAIRSSEREMADRVAQLERENTALREHTVDDEDSLPHRQPPVRDDTLVDQPSHRHAGGQPDNVVETDASRRIDREPTSTAHGHSAVDDYPPGPTRDDAERDRWPEPADPRAPEERPSARRERLTGRP